MTLAQLRKAIRESGEALSSLYGGVETARLALSRELHVAYLLFSQNEKMSEEFGQFHEWAIELCPGESRTSIYRLRAAGEVATIIGNTGAASERTLEPLARILSGSKTDEEREVAEKQVRELWTQADATGSNGRAPTIAVVTDLVEAVKPASKSKAKGKSSSAAKSATEAPSEPKAADVEAARKAFTGAYAAGEARCEGSTALLRTFGLVVVKHVEAQGLDAVRFALSNPGESK